MFMNNKYVQAAALLVLAVVALFVIQRKPQPQITDFQSCQLAGGVITDGDPVTCTALNGKIFSEATPEAEAVIIEPQYGEIVASPMTIKGKARGGWFFEATLPAVLKDDQGNVLAQGPMRADSDWQTPDFVNFSGTMTFDPGTAPYGVLIISKDNPSGLPANDASVAIPVRFK